MNTQQRQPKIIKQPFLYAGADFNMDDTVVEEAMAIARAYREASVSVLVERVGRSTLEIL